MATPIKEWSKLESTVHEIVHDTFGYRKVSARWVPKILTEDHKLQRVEISQRLLQRCQQDNGDEDTTHIGVGPGGDFQTNNNLFNNLITGDETWVHLNNPETKRYSMTWKHPSSPVTKKFKVQRSAAKVMATVFWDANGVILLNILPQGHCINAARYCSTLDRLKEAIRSKINGQNLNDLRYADDTVLIAEPGKQLQKFLDTVVLESERIGLSLNVKKTECMVISKKFSNPKCNLVSKGEKINQVTKFNYLGYLIHQMVDAQVKYMNE
ncbi:histone-lysine N-methyltransferase SETMAR [Plakobranchus ocellatus]|uniref:Histone-lysine N-methyltransferase SETMAR n=1 Tax=Plakobranchus ocellatus TaxID=259542 RepID=A0AAV4CA20_9GAST|nr:histone-lysine N-methyltransferase SETMAR [Plakobranchus ocellatus]